MFVPIHDQNPLKYIRFQYVTVSIIVLNVVIFFLVGDMNSDAREVIAALYHYSLIPQAVSDNPGIYQQTNLPFQSMRLITYAFMHADFWHLAGNMLFLWVFGDNVEDDLGHLKFLFFYLVACAVSGLFHVALVGEPHVPLVGASGAVSAVLAAYVVLHPQVRIWVLFLGRIPLRLPAIWLIAAWAGLQVFNLVILPDDQVSYAAHVGGLLVGFALLPFVRRRGN